MLGAAGHLLRRHRRRADGDGQRARSGGAARQRPRAARARRRASRACRRRSLFGVLWTLVGLETAIALFAAGARRRDGARRPRAADRACVAAGWPSPCSPWSASRPLRVRRGRGRSARARRTRSRPRGRRRRARPRAEQILDARQAVRGLPHARPPSSRRHYGRIAVAALDGRCAWAGRARRAGVPARRVRRRARPVPRRARHRDGRRRARRAAAGRARQFTLPGIPSRARISPDGALGRRDGVHRRPRVRGARPVLDRDDDHRPQDRQAGREPREGLHGHQRRQGRRRARPQLLGPDVRRRRRHVLRHARDRRQDVADQGLDQGPHARTRSTRTSSARRSRPTARGSATRRRSSHDPTVWRFHVLDLATGEETAARGDAVDRRPARAGSTTATCSTATRTGRGSSTRTARAAHGSGSRARTPRRSRAGRACRPRRMTRRRTGPASREQVAGKEAGRVRHRRIRRTSGGAGDPARRPGEARVPRAMTPRASRFRRTVGLDAVRAVGNLSQLKAAVARARRRRRGRRARAARHDRHRPHALGDARARDRGERPPALRRRRSRPRRRQRDRRELHGAQAGAPGRRRRLHLGDRRRGDRAPDRARPRRARPRRGGAADVQPAARPLLVRGGRRGRARRARRRPQGVPADRRPRRRRAVPRPPASPPSSRTRARCRRSRTTSWSC